MILEQSISPNLALHSYFVADEGEGIVIDPRRDVQVYLDFARDHNVSIRAIFESHRHEDHVLGTRELASLTGAEIYRSAHEKFDYGDGSFMKDGDRFSFGNLVLEALHTPGHTEGHLAYVLYQDHAPYAVFSGDALFYGEVGRSDFYGEERLEEMTGKVYDSIHKLAALGDEVLLYPAHGAGSACGANIKDLPISTIGIERATSPVFEPESREDFIKQYAKMQFKPAYFSLMEEWNVSGGPFIGNSNELVSLPIKGLMEDIQGKTLVDVRHLTDFSYHHLPGALFMGSGMLSKALGVFCKPEDEIILITDGLSPQEKSDDYWTLRRMGFDNIIGQVGDHMHLSLEQFGTYLMSCFSMTPETFLEDWSGRLVNLDVRFPEEIQVENVDFERSRIPLDYLPERISELNQDKPYATSCETGIRALVAASYLQKEGYQSVHIRGNLNFVDD